MMNAQTQSQAGGGPARNNALWAVVAVLGVAVVALASALYYVQSRQQEPHPVAVSPVPNPVVVLPAATTESAATTPAPVQAKSVPPDRKPVASKTASSRGSKPAQEALPAEPTAAGAPAPAAKAVCVNCATITAVTPIEREGTPSGAGAVAGGVLGALVGNQFGGGDGKTLATIAGAVGGGIAGNTVEKKMKKTTVYRVELRMDNGDQRSIEQATPVSVGARVRVEGDSLQPINP